MGTWCAFTGRGFRKTGNSLIFIVLAPTILSVRSHKDSNQWETCIHNKNLDLPTYAQLHYGVLFFEKLRTRSQTVPTKISNHNENAHTSACLNVIASLLTTGM
jgi:hypothetical protein